MTKTITEDQVYDTMKSLPKGRFLALSFIRRDGTLRSALCMLGARAVKSDSDFDSDRPRAGVSKDGWFGVYDSTKQEYAKISFGGLISFTCNGVTYIVNHQQQPKEEDK